MAIFFVRNCDSEEKKDVKISAETFAGEAGYAKRT
jgi:hypothetical protein